MTGNGCDLGGTNRRINECPDELKLVDCIHKSQAFVMIVVRGTGNERW